MEIIWGITLPFPQEYPEEPQRFHNLKPCVIMSYTCAYTNILCVIKRGGRAGAVGQRDALIWSLARCLQPRVSPSSSQTLPKPPDRGNHHVLQQCAPASTILAVHPAPPMCDHVHNSSKGAPALHGSAFETGCGGASQRAAEGGDSKQSWQFSHLIPPSSAFAAQHAQDHYPGVMGDDPEEIFNPIQAHPLLSDNCLGLPSSLPAHPCPGLKAD